MADCILWFDEILISDEFIYGQPLCMTWNRMVEAVLSVIIHIRWILNSINLKIWKLGNLKNMAVRVVEFSSGVYKIGKIFA